MLPPCLHLYQFNERLESPKSIIHHAGSWHGIDIDADTVSKIGLPINWTPMIVITICVNAVPPGYNIEISICMLEMVKPLG